MPGLRSFEPARLGRGVVSPCRTLIKGLLVLGDSRSDEYQADDARGGTYAATTFNWLELLVRFRGVNAGPWGTRASPRRTGYEYNWALSASRVADVISDGQHTGGAAQVTAGLVSHAFLDIGANDFAIFNGTYAEIYNSTLDDAGVASKVSAMVAGITTIVDTVLAAGAVKFLVCNLVDRGQGATFQATFPNATQRARVTSAVVSVNSGLASMAASRPVVLVDSYNTSNALLANVDGNGFYHINGQLIDMVGYGDEPHHLLLGDNEHVGTVMSGVAANVYSAIFRNQLGIEMPAFSDAEITANAGI